MTKTGQEIASYYWISRKTPTKKAVGKMWNCGMRNAEGKMQNGMCGKLLRNGG